MKFSCLHTVQSSYFFCKNSLPLPLSTFSSISILFFICSAISIQLYLPPSHNHHFPSSPFMFDCKCSGWPNTLQVPVLWSRSKPRSQVTRSQGDLSWFILCHEVFTSDSTYFRMGSGKCAGVFLYRLLT